MPSPLAVAAMLCAVAVHLLLLLLPVRPAALPARLATPACAACGDPSGERDLYLVTFHRHMLCVMAVHLLHNHISIHHALRETPVYTYNLA